jgi:hypothetical protein
VFDWVRRLFGRRTLRDDDISSSSALPATLFAGSALDDAKDDSSGSDSGASSESGGWGSFGGGSDSGGGGADGGGS